jgi:hypothetical protein
VQKLEDRNEKKAINGASEGKQERRLFVRHHPPFLLLGAPLLCVRAIPLTGQPSPAGEGSGAIS